MKLRRIDVTLTVIVEDDGDLLISTLKKHIEESVGTLGHLRPEDELNEIQSVRVRSINRRRTAAEQAQVDRRLALSRRRKEDKIL